MNLAVAEQAFRQAVSHFEQGQLDQAASRCAQSLSLAPGAPDPLHLMGVIRAQQGRFADAAELLGRAVEADPGRIDAMRVRGIVLFSLGRHDEAFASFDRALALRPDFAPALTNRGDALRKLGRHAESLADYDRALALDPNGLDTLFNKGLSLFALGRLEEAAACNERVLARRPDHLEALFNHGNALRRLGRLAEALASYDRALAIKPDYLDVAFNRGLALLQLGRHEEALAAYDGVLARRPDDADALNNRGNALRNLHRYDEAVASYDRALAVNPAQDFAFSAAVHLRRMMCDWHDLDRRQAALIDRAQGAGAASDPFPLLAITDDTAVLQTAARRHWDSRRAGRAPLPSWPAKTRPKIRLGYLSGDLRLHAIAVQTVELFELHDRSRFDVLAFSYGRDDGSEMRRRLVRAFDEFHDLAGRGSPEIARHMREREIDILIDLSGYVTDGRAEILEHRAAPVQVHYFGYPGPMGCDAIDYMLVDRFIVPPDRQAHYTETLVYLPDCYMVSDRQRRIAETRPTRAECGLPEDGFVFCSFNNSYKITPPVFDVWMRLLGAVPRSVLWLLGDNRWAEDNLRREAAARGVDPARLVFVPRRPPAEHLARHAHADLLLDTLPYNAHVTASDALWAGLPLITCAGRSFASRVAGSLLHAVGLPELVTETLAGYEALALRLATEPGLLRSVRDRLVANRATAPLFDSVRTTRQIETAYERMIERSRHGLPPESFGVG